MYAMYQDCRRDLDEARDEIEREHDAKLRLQVPHI